MAGLERDVWEVADEGGRCSKAVQIIPFNHKQWYNKNNIRSYSNKNAMCVCARCWVGSVMASPCWTPASSQPVPCKRLSSSRKNTSNFNMQSRWDVKIRRHASPLSMSSCFILCLNPGLLFFYYLGFSSPRFSLYLQKPCHTCLPHLTPSHTWNGIMNS